MPRFRKRHKLGFQLNNVPQTKGEIKFENEFIPPSILRLDEETRKVVGNPKSLSKGVEMVSRANVPKLLRPISSSKGAHVAGMTQAEMQRQQ